MTKTMEWIALNRPEPKEETSSGVSLQNTSSVKEQLLKELIELEKQSEMLRTDQHHVDFSMIQTYREMIHSRESFFNELSG